jgi:ELWxxDGT repeat protein
VWIASTGDQLYFGADDGVHGKELWVSDGTESGTASVQDLFPGPRGSDPQGFAFVGGTLFFTAAGPGIGRELWRLDG